MRRKTLLPLVLGVAGLALLAVVVASVTGSTGDQAATADRPAALVVSPSGAATAPDGLSAAMDRYQAQLRATPKDYTAWAGLGSTYIQQARITGDPTWYPKAEGALRRSLALDPDDNWAAMTGMGALANSRHDFSTALGWARRAAAVNAYSATVHGVMDDALTQLGRYSEADDAVRRMLELQPGIPSFTRAAYHSEERGDVSGARAALERALGEATSPADLTFCRFQLGELAFDNGHPLDALHQFEAGLRTDPQSSQLLAGRAKAEVALGRTGAALHDYAMVTSRVPQPQWLLEYAELLQSLERDDQARRQLDLITAEQQLLAANGVVDDLTAATVEADHGSATAAVRHAEAEWGRRHSVLVEDALAWALHRAGRDHEALPHAVRANRLGWRNAGFRYHLGMIELSLGRRADAGRDLAAALRINPYFSVLQAPVARRAVDAAADPR